MDKHDEFDKDFDFEKEYGIDPNQLFDPEYASDEELESDFDASDDLDFLKDFDEKFGVDLDKKLAAEFGETAVFTPVETEKVSSEPAFADEALPEDEEENLVPDFMDTTYSQGEPTKILPAFDLPEFDEKVIDPTVFEDSDADAQTSEEPKAEEPEEEIVPVPPRAPRRKMSRERMIKEVYLPPVIAALTLVLCATFIFGGVSRKLKDKPSKPNTSTTQNGEDEQARLQKEAEQLVKEAAALAAGYDYQGALDKLNSFSDKDNMDKYPSMIDKRSEYATMKDQVQPWNDPSSITNLSFHCLIVDPNRAFPDKQFGPSYLMNFVTASEFSKILDQLYANGYVLVGFKDFVEEVEQEDGTVTFKTKPIYLPAGRKPLMLTATLLNYFEYMIGEDSDGKYGDGFARKLIVENGKFVNEMQETNGNITYGSYDFVPLLEDFIADHPDFSYHGSRAIIAVTGEEGVFGYRTMPSVIKEKGQDYYDNEVKCAKEVAQALRDAGYVIACNTYGNDPYLEISATEIKADLDLWKAEVTPVLGEVDTIVYARGSDITTGANYSGNKYNVLKTMGFRYFVGAADVAWCEVTGQHVRQTRLMVTGTMLQNAGSTFSSYFDAKSVLCAERNNKK